MLHTLEKKESKPNVNVVDNPERKQEQKKINSFSSTRYVFHQVGECAGGLVDGLTGLPRMFINPGRTVRGIGQVITDPVTAGKNFVTAFKEKPVRMTTKMLTGSLFLDWGLGAISDVAIAAAQVADSASVVADIVNTVSVISNVNDNVSVVADVADVADAIDVISITGELTDGGSIIADVAGVPSKITDIAAIGADTMHTAPVDTNIVSTSGIESIYDKTNEGDSFLVENKEIAFIVKEGAGASTELAEVASVFDKGSASVEWSQETVFMVTDEAKIAATEISLIPAQPATITTPLEASSIKDAGVSSELAEAASIVDKGSISANLSQDAVSIAADEAKVNLTMFSSVPLEESVATTSFKASSILAKATSLAVSTTAIGKISTAGAFAGTVGVIYAKRNACYTFFSNASRIAIGAAGVATAAVVYKNFGCTVL